MPGRRSRKKPPPPAPKTQDPGPLAHQPFQVLKGLNLNEKEQAVPPQPQPKQPPPSSEADLFQSAMAGVTPLARGKSRVAHPRRPKVGPDCDEDLEVLAQLEDLVAGRARFDLADTDEYLEGFVRGIHPYILDKLRQGLFPVQAHLDLHGLSVPEATEAVREFIAEAMALSHRCVLLVHGRGLNSKDQIPVLKKKLETILLRPPVKKYVLAFTSARPHDGGTGASYVLLRARR